MAMNGPTGAPEPVTGGRKPGSLSVGSDSDGRGARVAVGRGVAPSTSAPAGRSGAWPIPPPVGSNGIQP